MAKGQFRAFNQTINNIGKKGFDLSTAGDYKIMLITTLPTTADLTPDSTDYVEVSGGGYTAGGILLNVTWLEAAGVNTFDSTIDPSWTQNGTGPVNIVAGLVYSITEVANDAIGFIDLTDDGGTTPISLQAGDISITWPATGLFDISRP